MGATLYKEVTYNLKSLIEDIALGEIALPDLQRQFVWPNAKVRDLFDSMFRGYPVGYLLFWATGADVGKVRTIGSEAKQKAPGRLVVDGQQRLTSLFAVMKGMEVIKDGLERERIQIAFCPTTQKFEVLDAAVGRDPEFIPDISKVWARDTGKARFVKDYLARLRESRSVTEAEEEHISDAIDRLYNLENFPFYALELSSTVDEEQVAEVFVRINYQGKSLNQADFILTLMSVFWDEGRRTLENFCLDTRRPCDERTSPFNHIAQPGADDLLRVIVGLGFGRGRLKYGYSILRGKDLETGEISTKRREEQFNVLRSSQENVLNLTNWHEFLKVPMTAGFMSADMISSQVGLLFAYTLYLIGHRDFKIDRGRLRTACARWLFMSALTSRYTGSPESDIEKDIIAFRSTKSGDAFLAHLDRVIESELTNDFWDITLPGELNSSAARGPALFAYQAALCILGAKPLLSNLRLRELFNPYIKGPRANVERHHLFPKNHLKSLGLTGVREINQIANYAWVEWVDNGEISDDAPSIYFPPYLEKMSEETKKEMFYWHALPDHWWTLTYDEFLEKRRKLIARVIRDGFQKIGPG